MNEHRGVWRGKGASGSGKWYEGLLIYRNIYNTRAIIHDNKTYADVWVDPSTLGECTGLPDKNDKLIFEGDIVKTKKYGKIVAHSNVDDYDIFVVKYEPALFRLENHNRGFSLVDDGYSKFEIIGNIHDNPELIQKGAAE